jgi:hypothetical protein
MEPVFEETHLIGRALRQGGFPVLPAVEDAVFGAMKDLQV